MQNRRHRQQRLDWKLYLQQAGFVLARFGLVWFWLLFIGASEALGAWITFNWILTP